MHLIELAESRASEARLKADTVALAAAAKISDLDQEETPESIMLRSMTYEGGKGRTNREVVVPWLKFLWETYRTILELLYKNTRLEKVYHRTCEKAFKFCLDYQRYNEFRRLCEMLRAHFTNLMRATQQSLKANKPAWEWTVEGIEFHLQTRFSQLEVASSLELWNEGFRTVEDIYDIMQINKKTPKSRLMVAYYEKLTRIFWVSENYLFHAYAWYRYYCLCLECKKDMKPEEKVIQASCVLLAALCIPNFRETDHSTSALEDDEVLAEKNAHMALLLDFQANPTRAALLAEIVSKGVLNEVSPELSALYSLLETGFRPLNVIQDITPVLAFIKQDTDLCLYSIPLQRVTVLKSMMQLSRVFSTLKMSTLKDMVLHLDLSYCDVEKLLVDSASSKQLQLRFDHYNACIRFGTTIAITSAIDSHLSSIGSQLTTITDTISSVTLPEQSVQASNLRREYLETVSESLDDFYALQIERKNYIEKRKESMERVIAEKQRVEAQLKEAEESRRKEEENQRLKKEEELRKIAKEKKIKDQIDVAKTKKALEAHGKIVDESVLIDLDETSRRALLKEAQTDAQKAKEEEARRLHEQHKKLDYITRALRIEASEIISKKYEEDVKADRQHFEEKVALAQVKQQEDFQLALQEKARFARTMPLRTEFEATIIAKQKAAFDARAASEYTKALNEHRQRKVARARQLYGEEMERLEEEAELEKEALEKEEEQRRLEEAQEEKRRQKAALEEEKKARDADLERKRQEKLADIARSKREAEEAEQSRRAVEEEAWMRKKSQQAEQQAEQRSNVTEQPARDEWRGSGRDERPMVRQAAGGEPQPWRASRPDPQRPLDAEGAAPESGGWGRAPKAEAPPVAATGGSALDRVFAARGTESKRADPGSRWGGEGKTDARDDGKSSWRK